MYLSVLSDQEKLAFYSLAENIARAEGGVCDQEEKLLCAVAREMGIPKPGNILDVSTACKVFTTATTQKIALLELMLIALVDEDYATEEKEFMTKVTLEFGLSKDILNRAEAWAESVLSLYRSGVRFAQAQ